MDHADRRRRRHDAFSVDSGGRSLVGITNLDAPRGRVVRVALDVDVLAAGPEAWETIVAERDDVIAQLAVTAPRPADGHQRRRRRHRPPPRRRRNAARHASTASASASRVADDGLAADPDLDDAFVVVDTFAAPTSLWKVPANGSATPADGALATPSS